MIRKMHFNLKQYFDLSHFGFWDIANYVFFYFLKNNWQKLKVFECLSFNLWVNNTALVCYYHLFICHFKKVVIIIEVMKSQSFQTPGETNWSRIWFEDCISEISKSDTFECRQKIISIKMQFFVLKEVGISGWNGLCILFTSLNINSTLNELGLITLIATVYTLRHKATLMLCLHRKKRRHNILSSKHVETATALGCKTNWCQQSVRKPFRVMKSITWCCIQIIFPKIWALQISSSAALWETSIHHHVFQQRLNTVWDKIDAGHNSVCQ